MVCAPYSASAGTLPNRLRKIFHRRANAYPDSALVNRSSAARMEAREIAILRRGGIENPYTVESPRQA
jgi:hypothetical protein